MSAEMICSPSSPRRIVRSSRVVQPPVSGVPVAGAKAGSIESIWTLKEESQEFIFTRRNDNTYVYGEIDRLVADSLSDLLYDPIRTCEWYTVNNCTHLSET